MSFILDAIAKSERERQQQELPGPRILALPASPAPRTRSLLPYIVIGALLLNAGVLVAWMQSGESLRRSPISAPTVAGANEYEQRSAAVDAAAPEDPTMQSESQVTPAQSTLEDTAVEPAVQVDARVASVSDSAPTGLAVDEPNSGVPPAPASEDDTADWIRIGPETLSQRVRSGQPVAPLQRTSVSAAPPIKVSSLSELPPDVRNDLPKVVFSGHLYSSDPESSIVFVDEGRPVTQGRQIAADLFLREITPKGVVVEFRGYLIDVGVLQNWTLN